jgi:branched-chain amino acid aminotransferase
MGTQDYVPDPRNDRVLVYVDGALVPRAQAKVSVFDSGFVLGDGVWEGFRLHKGKLAFLDAHLDRLYAGARTIALDIGRTRAELVAALRETLDANGMTDGVHVRLMITRGPKRTPNQDPRHGLGRPTIVIVAEHKTPPPLNAGIRLHTSRIRCSPAEIFDMRLNSHSRLNLILALNEAIAAGCDEALMLDPRGFVSSCNATNFFFVRDGRVCTSAGEYCFNGITRANVIALCRDNGIAIELGDFPRDDAHSADEAFCTGTMGGIAAVGSVDGHDLSRGGLPGPVTARLTGLYRDLLDRC